MSNFFSPESIDPTYVCRLGSSDRNQPDNGKLFCLFHSISVFLFKDLGLFLNLLRSFPATAHRATNTWVRSQSTAKKKDWIRSNIENGIRKKTKRGSPSSIDVYASESINVIQSLNLSFLFPSFLSEFTTLNTFFFFF